MVALATGGSDKATAPIVPPVHTTAKKKPAPQPAATQATPSQTATTPTAPTQTSAAAGTDITRGTQLHEQAHGLIGQGRYEDAIALERQAVQMLKGTGSLEYAYALFDLGHALRLAGHPTDAIPILEQRLQIDNQRPVVQAELSKARAEAKKG
jgi:serine/threonine-protein kinase